MSNQQIKQMKETIEYFIGTGYKSDFYTLWKTIKIDQRKRDNEGNIIPSYSDNINAAGSGTMNFFVRTSFVQNLSKTKAGAIQKAKELGVVIDAKEFDFSLKHNARPNQKAFGANMKFKSNNNKNYWIAEATPAFWEQWKANKDELKSSGWAVWKAKKSGVWYMIQNEIEAN